MRHPKPSDILEAVHRPRGRVTRAIAALLLAVVAAGAMHWARVEWQLHKTLAQAQAARSPASFVPPGAQVPGAAIVVVDWTPPITVTEDAQRYLLQIDVSNSDVTTLRTELEERSLRISGTRLVNRGTLTDEALPRSSIFVRFEQTLHFAAPVQGPPRATFNKGVFTLAVHKLQSHRTDRISVR